MTEPYMKMTEIETKYRNLWVLIADTKSDRRYQLLGGHVVLSHPSKSEFVRLWTAWDDATGRKHNIATLFMGPLPEDEVLHAESEPGAA